MKYRRVVDFRNQIMHGYFGIDERIVWDVIVTKLPEYKNDLNTIVSEASLDLSFSVMQAKKEYCEQKDVMIFLENLTQNSSED